MTLTLRAAATDKTTNAMEKTQVEAASMMTTAVIERTTAVADTRAEAEPAGAATEGMIAAAAVKMAETAQVATKPCARGKPVVAILPF